MGDYDPAVRERVRELLANRTHGPADDAPPPPKAAIELLRATGFPFKREQSAAA
jgi:hypothetical protein